MTKDTPIAKAIGKVIIAAAWADGSIQKEEIDCLKDLLFQLPELADADWAELNKFLESPIGQAEREIFVAELRELLASEEERDFAFYALDRVVDADGVVTEHEQKTIDAIKKALVVESEDALHGIARLLHQPIKARIARSEGKSLDRVFDLEETIHSRVSNMRDGRFALNLCEEELRKLVLAGLLMARVVRADGRIDDAEVEATTRYLIEKWELCAEEAQFVIVVSLSDEVPDMDTIRICRAFYEITSLKERVQFLDVLFQVGMVDGHLSEDEVDEVLNICANIKLEQNYFHAAFSRVVGNF